MTSTHSTDAGIQVEGLVKRFGRTAALDGLDLVVPAGTVCGLLGPNGAGKTTAVRILTTLLRADAGRATVAGADVRTEPDAVRRRIGVSGQEAAVDEILGGRQNLVLFARLLGLSRAAAHRRAAELLDRFGLTEAADRAVRHYSGGMRRRLDLAVTLLLAPRVLFLDEPTTGLDPRNRAEVWDAVRALAADGTTVLLTTQYLDEADRLADAVVVVDHGRAIAAGSPAELKRAVAADRLEIVVRTPADLPPAQDALARHALAPPDVDVEARRVTVAVREPVEALADVLAVLRDAGVRLADAALRRPTLDDVFLQLTGHRTDDVPGPAPTTQRGAA